MLAISAEEDSNPKECAKLLQDTIEEWLHEMTQHMPEDIFILPWFNNEKKALRKPSQIPTNPIERAAYFPKLMTPKETAI